MKKKKFTKFTIIIKIIKILYYLKVVPITRHISSVINNEAIVVAASVMLGA